jgi:glutathione S-transferase
MNPTGNIPIIEMPDRKILTQSYAILRHWGRLLHVAEHKTRNEDEKYWADAIWDIVIDCENVLLLK